MTGTRCSNSAIRATHVWTSTGSNRGRGSFGEPRVGSEETAESFAARGDDGETAACMSSSPVVGNGFARSSVSRLPAMDLIGRQRIVELVAEHAHQSLPGLQFFFAQGARQVGDHQQLVRQAAFAKLAARNAPAAGCRPGKCAGRCGRLAFEELGQPESFGAGTSSRCVRRAAPAAARPRDSPGAGVLAVEGEHRDVDLLHHFAQQRGRFERAQPLRAQRRAHGVDLLHHFAKRVLPAAPRARME